MLARTLIILALALSALSTTQTASAQSKEKGISLTGIHAFTMKTIDGKTKKLADYKGNVVLVVNVASFCGYTKQYSTLEKLYQEYKDKGFIILGFPSNDFGEQEPGTDEEIKEFCSTKYNVSFDMFSKITVKGEGMHPLYTYLTKNSGHDGDIGWNFTKFLIDRDGTVAARFGTKVDPMGEELRGAVQTLISK